MLIARIAAFLAGIRIVFSAVRSAIRTFVLPRSAGDRIAGFVYANTRRIFDYQARRKKTYAEHDRIRALLSPISLVALLPTWLVIASIGYMFLFWGSGYGTFFESWVIAGSSLLTLGFAKGETFLQMSLAFTAATIGLLLVALLIAYLPTMYASFAKREVAVNLLAAGAGTPPSATELLMRYNRLGRLDELSKLWESWEEWFAEIEESHTSLSPLILFRSPVPEHSWVTAAGAVLDAAALSLSAVVMPGSPAMQEMFRDQKIPADPQAALCIRMGFIALRSIASLLLVEFNPAPHFPKDPISISREEFDAALDELAAGGVPLKGDRDQAWQDYAGWRVNYDTVLLALAEFVMAPLAPWTSDRLPVYGGLKKGFKPRIGTTWDS
ncbi:MAG: hypothetical protein IIC79_07080 [Chloroflexi bacterium]|nr:hypothetical protein [Chloroflexota bacterium]